MAPWTTLRDRKRRQAPIHAYVRAALRADVYHRAGMGTHLAVGVSHLVDWIRWKRPRAEAGHDRRAAPWRRQGDHRAPARRDRNATDAIHRAAELAGERTADDSPS